MQHRFSTKQGGGIPFGDFRTSHISHHQTIADLGHGYWGDSSSIISFRNSHGHWLQRFRLKRGSLVRRNQDLISYTTV